MAVISTFLGKLWGYMAMAEKKRLQRLVFGRGRRVDQGLRAQFYEAVRALSFLRKARVKKGACERHQGTGEELPERLLGFFQKGG